MLTLITGLPGAGKTLYAIHYVDTVLKADPHRPVFQSGINELARPWGDIDPQKWYTVPDGAIVIIDECQRVFRPRMHGSEVPRFVSELETHRHRGIDVILITQHPMLLDANARRLVGRHFHVVRTFGFQAATVHEWASVKENCDKSRADSSTHKWPYPKDLYASYKSAEVHTHKPRLPMRIVMLGVLAVGLPVSTAIIWHRFHHWGQVSRAPAPAAAPSSPAARRFAAAPSSSAHLSRAEYLSQTVPRVPGLVFTAPRYDEVTRPVRAPYPAACVSMGRVCQCYSQQGTRLGTSHDLCVSIVSGGFFKDWDDRDDQDAQQDRRRAAEAAADRPSTDQQRPPGGQVGDPMAPEGRLRLVVEAAAASNPEPPKPRPLLRGGTFSGMSSAVSSGDSPPPVASPSDLALASFVHGR